MMAGIQSRNTAPELRVRSYLHACGLRFRVHVRDLPGRPDIVLPRHRAVVFVHGCFWHRHQCCRFATVPATRTDFWRAKFQANIARDSSNQLQLTRAGWNVLSPRYSGIAVTATHEQPFSLVTAVVTTQVAGSRAIILPFPRPQKSPKWFLRDFRMSWGFPRTSIWLPGAESHHRHADSNPGPVPSLFVANAEARTTPCGFRRR